MKIESSGALLMVYFMGGEHDHCTSWGKINHSSFFRNNLIQKYPFKAVVTINSYCLSAGKAIKDIGITQ